MNYYRRFMGDYAAKTADLSLAEHGAYNVLLDTCYSTERPLPGAYDALYRLCRAMSKVEQAAVRSVADRFFPLGEDGLRRNSRASEEISKAQSTIAKQRESGVESAAKRWSTDESTHTDEIQPPTSNPQPLTASPKPRTSTRQRKAGADADAPPTGQTWVAYRAAYEKRYGFEPPPSAEDNAHMLAFVRKVPAEDAPEVAAFYVRHNKRWYVEKCHAVKYLREDAAGLHTQWRNGRTVTSTEAHQADKTQATGNAFAPLLAEAEERERLNDARE